MLTKLSTFSGVAPDGEPLVQIFRPGQSIKKLAGPVMPEIQDWLGTYKSDMENIALLVNALGASEYYGSNVNGDRFRWPVLEHDCRTHGPKDHGIDDFTNKIIPPYGYWTFYTAHAFAHHRNKDPNRAFGTIQVACLNPAMKRVELVVLVNRDKALCNGAAEVVAKIDDGHYPSTSMGCRTPYDICEICGNKSKTRKDYCIHIKKYGMGHIFPDGRQVSVDNPYPRFFDISFVFIGADKTSWVMSKLASVEHLPQSIVDADHLYGPMPEEGLMKAASVSSFKIEKAREATGEPKKHYLVSGLETDGKGKVKIEKLAPPPPASKEVSTEDLRTVAKRMNLSKNLARFILTKHGSETQIEDPFTPPMKVAQTSTTPPYSKDEAGYMPTSETDKNKRCGVCEHFIEPQGCDLVDGPIELGGVCPLFEGKDEKTAAIKIGPPPTPNRKEYPYEGTAVFQGLKIYIENKPGSVREGKGWKTKMINAYGEILGTKGTDKDRLDVYLGPNPKAKFAYIVHQNFVKTGKYDEDKAMLGFNSPEEAKGAYLKHYDSPKFFRSMTIMPMTTFKKVIKGEVKGEKVASLEKIAADIKLEDLFSSKKPVRRERIWRNKVSGEETYHVGSGLGDSFSNMEKTAAINPFKLASHKKWAEIVKEIGPEAAIGKVSPLLAEREPDLPIEVLDELGKGDLRSALSTPSLMGMVLRPREFQRIILVSLGQKGLADHFGRRGEIFGPASGETPLCDQLGPQYFLKDLMRKLLPFLEERSYAQPVMERRVVRITIAPKRDVSEKISKSPLLSKVSSAYNWYRREMIKAATYAPEIISEEPELQAGLYDMRDSDIFKVGEIQLPPALRGGIRVPDRNTILAVLGSIPLTLMYSAHLRGEAQQGEDLNILSKLIADHPWLTAMGGAAAIRQIMKTPQAQQAAQELEQAGGRIVRGTSA